MLVVICCLQQLVFGVVINNPAYQVEQYFTYDASTLGSTRDFTFDSSGNIYVAHGFQDTARNGSVQKISTDKSISDLRTDLVDPRYIIWGGGTSFGDNLYVSDPQENANWSSGEITQLDLAGNKTPFCGGSYYAGALAIDQTGNYDNMLYTANSVDDKILRVGPSGGTASTFSSFPGNYSGGMFGMAFDTTDSYGGGMYVSNRYVDNLSVAGLFHIDTNGNATRYADIEQGGCIAFDDTSEQYFDGKMYAAGRLDSENLWTLYKVNGFYDKEVFGAFEFTRGTTRPDIEFGPDGAMYVMEWDAPNMDVVISRITPVPEPVTLMLLGLGGIALRKRK